MINANAQFLAKDACPASASSSRVTTLYHKILGQQVNKVPKNTKERKYSYDSME